MNKISYARHRFPPSVIQRAVWLYFRFPLSFRYIEEMLAERGIDISCETIRRWILKFGSAIAANVISRRVQTSGTWHLDEVLSALLKGGHIFGAQWTMKTKFLKS